MEASRSVPANLLALENGCGVVSAWMALQHFRKRVAVAQLAKQCKHSGQRGVFAIAIAVALKRYGLDVSFHTEEDNDKKPIEVAGYRAAARLNLPVLPALRVGEIARLMKENRFVILLFDTRDGHGHFSPIRSIGKYGISFEYSSEPVLSIRTFQKRWGAPGVCRQAIVVG